MKKFAFLLLASISWLLTACSPVKTPVTNQYILGSFSNKHIASHPTKYSILVTTPEAVAGYQTEQMLYIKKPFELNAFANNAWADPPADMLFPLLLQSLQKSGYFYAVASSPHSEETDYRLDTQLLELNQNFLTKPSSVDFTVKSVLTQVKDNRVVASRISHQRIPATAETPYGGVIAANKAVLNFTGEVTQFVIDKVRQDA